MKDRLGELQNFTATACDESCVSNGCATASTSARSSPRFQHVYEREEDGVVVCSLLSGSSSAVSGVDVAPHSIYRHSNQRIQSSSHFDASVNDLGSSTPKFLDHFSGNDGGSKFSESGEAELQACHGHANFGAFLQKVNVIQLASRAAAENTDRIKYLKYAAFHTASPEKEKELFQKLHETFEDNTLLITKLRYALDSMRNDNDRFPAGYKNSSTWRSRKNIELTLLRKFRACVQEYRLVQAEHKQEISEKVLRQLKIVYPNATSADVSSIMEAGHKSSGDLIKFYFGDGVDDLNVVMDDIRNKWTDIKKLEAGVLELNQIFNELAIIVGEQEASLDDIELAVTQTKLFSDDAIDELKRTKKARFVAMMRKASYGGGILLLISFIFYCCIYRKVLL